MQRFAVEFDHRVVGIAVRVAGGTTIAYDLVSDAPLRCVDVEGHLAFRADANTRMKVGTITVLEGGRLDIGTPETPIAAGATAEVIIADQKIDTARDPEQMSGGLIGLGTVKVHGAVKAPTFVRFSAEPIAGQQVLDELAGAAGDVAQTDVFAGELQLADRQAPEEFAELAATFDQMDTFLARFDAAGVPLWTRRLGASGLGETARTLVPYAGGSMVLGSTWDPTGSFWTAFLIRLESPGSPVFRQARIGRDGRRFRVYKLRTMRSDAPAADLSVDDFNTFLFTPSHDPRRTRIGALLRTTSLDEAMQLLNVVRGEMAIVGPRPTVQEQVDRYTERQLRRLEVKPGITGWAQVNGRTSLPWPERIELDVWYVDNRSLRLDLRILARTARMLLTGRGLYSESLKQGWE